MVFAINAFAMFKFSKMLYLLAFWGLHSQLDLSRELYEPYSQLFYYVAPEMLICMSAVFFLILQHSVWDCHSGVHGIGANPMKWDQKDAVPVKLTKMFNFEVQFLCKS